MRENQMFQSDVKPKQTNKENRKNVCNNSLITTSDLSGLNNQKQDMIAYLSLQAQKRARYNNTRHLRDSISVFTHNLFRLLAMKSHIFNQSSDVIEEGIHLAMIEYNPPQHVH